MRPPAGPITCPMSPATAPEPRDHLLKSVTWQAGPGKPHVSHQTDRLCRGWSQDGENILDVDRLPAQAVACAGIRNFQ